jgi:hypothetical protein
VDLALRLNAEERPASARALQNGLMGKEAREEKSVNLVTPGHGSGFIGISDAIVQPQRKKKRRGFLESTFLFLLATTAMAIAAAKILIDTGRLEEAELYGWLDRAQQLPYEAERFINAQLGIGRPATAAPPPAPRRVVRPRPAPEKVIPPFVPEKTIALTLAARVPVASLAFARDNGMLVVAHEDGAVNLRDAATGELLSNLKSSAASLGALALSADGRWLALPVDPKAVEVRDLQTNVAVAKLTGHAADITRLAFTADGGRLVTVDRDSVLILWDMAEHKKIFDLPPAKHEILALAVAPNGNVLAGGDIEGGIQYWDLASGKELAYVPAQPVPIGAMAYSPDGKWLASGGQQHNLKLWGAGMNRDDRVLRDAPEEVNVLQFTPDSRWLLLGGKDRPLEIIEVEQGQVAHRLAGHDNGVSVVAVSSDGTRLATFGADGKILIWK